MCGFGVPGEPCHIQVQTAADYLDLAHNSAIEQVAIRRGQLDPIAAEADIGVLDWQAAVAKVAESCLARSRRARDAAATFLEGVSMAADIVATHETTATQMNSLCNWGGVEVERDGVMGGPRLA